MENKMLDQVDIDRQTYITALNRAREGPKYKLQLKNAREKGYGDEFEIGFEEGFEEGYKIGFAEGRALEIRRIAKRMLGLNVETDFITEITGLSSVDIEELSIDTTD